MLSHFHPEGLLLLLSAATTEHHREVRANLLLSPCVPGSERGTRGGGLVLVRVLCSNPSVLGTE